MGGADQLRRNPRTCGKNKKQAFVLQQMLEYGREHVVCVRLRLELVRSDPGQRQKPAKPLRVLSQEGEGPQRDYFSLISNHSLNPLILGRMSRSSSPRGSSLTVGYGLESKLATDPVGESVQKGFQGSRLSDERS